jgi:hypothetical protein
LADQGLLQIACLLMRWIFSLAVLMARGDRAKDAGVRLPYLVRVLPIQSLDDLAADTFESDEELADFLAFTYAERHRDLA